MLGNESRANILALMSKGAVHDMITKEEKVIFEYELKKLTEEYQECPDTPLKKKIQDDAQWLKSVIFSTSGRKQHSKL